MKERRPSLEKGNNILASPKTLKCSRILAGNHSGSVTDYFLSATYGGGRQSTRPQWANSLSAKLLENSPAGSRGLFLNFRVNTSLSSYPTRTSRSESYLWSRVKHLLTS